MSIVSVTEYSLNFFNQVEQMILVI